MPTSLPGSPRSVSHEVLNAASAVRLLCRLLRHLLWRLVRRLLSAPGPARADTPGAGPSACVLPRRSFSTATCADGRSDNPFVWNPEQMLAIVASFC